MSERWIPRLIAASSGENTGDKRTSQLVAILGAAILSFGFMWWIGGTMFAAKAPPHIVETVETHKAGVGPNLASDYQQRLDLYYKARGESERLRETPTGSYPSSVTEPSAVGADAPIRQAIIRQSIAQYQSTGHPCACPYNMMRNGRSCGNRSAYSRPGGASPLCYARDVSDGMVAEWKRSHP